MERLTERWGEGDVWVKEYDYVSATHCLADYEDTGLAPEEIARIRAAIEVGYMKSIARAYGIDVKRLKELAIADREGRVVVMPCRLLDTVYVNGAKRTIRVIIDEMYLDDDKGIEYLVSFVCDHDCDGCPFSSWQQDHEGEWSCDGEWGQSSIRGTDFGKTVFLTREEAEKALEARNGNQ